MTKSRKFYVYDKMDDTFKVFNSVDEVLSEASLYTDYTEEFNDLKSAISWLEDCNLMFLTYRQYLDGKKYGINVRMA